MEIRNKLIVTRGEGGGKMGERRGTVQSRNKYKEPMVMDNRVGTD